MVAIKHMIAPLALTAFELEDQGISVKIEDDKLVISREDGKQVEINCIYTKEQIDSLITLGTLPSDLKNIILNHLNEYINSFVSLNKITYSNTTNTLTQSSIKPQNLLELTSTLSSNDRNIVDSLRRFCTVKDVEDLMSGIVPSDNESMQMIEQLRNWLENQYLPNLNKKFIAYDEKNDQLLQVILEVSKKVEEEGNGFDVALPDGTSLTFTKDEITNVLTKLFELYSMNANNEADAIMHLDKKQRELIDAIPTQSSDGKYEIAESQTNHIHQWYSSITQLYNSVAIPFCKFAIRVVDGVYQLVVFVVQQFYEVATKLTNLVVIPLSQYIWERIHAIDYQQLYTYLLSKMSESWKRLQNTQTIKHIVNKEVEQLTFTANIGDSIDSLDENIVILNQADHQPEQTITPTPSPTPTPIPTSIKITPQFEGNVIYRSREYLFRVSIEPINIDIDYGWKLYGDDIHEQTSFTGNTLRIDSEQESTRISIQCYSNEYNIESNILTYDIQPEFTPTFTPSPLPQPTDIVILYPEHMQSLIKGESYTLQAKSLPEDSNQEIIWSVTGTTKSTLINSILTIGDDEDANSITITAISETNEDITCSIECNIQSLQPKKIHAEYVFDKKNPPRLIQQEWMKSFRGIDSEQQLRQWNDDLHYIVPTEHDNVIVLLESVSNNGIFGGFHYEVIERENGMGERILSLRSSLLKHNSRTYKCSGVRLSHTINHVKFHGMYWILQDKTPNIQLLNSIEEALTYITPSIDMNVLDSLIDSYNNTVDIVARLQNNANTPPSPQDSFFELRESDQLYLYKPSLITQTNDFYQMTWNIDIEQPIPLATVFSFKDYLYGHTWSLLWDGNRWTGNNCINRSFAKLSSHKETKNDPTLIVHHTDSIAKWIDALMATKSTQSSIAEHSLPEDHSSTNFAEILAPYLTNWRLIHLDGSILELDNIITIETTTKLRDTVDDKQYDYYKMTIKANHADDMNCVYLLADLNINGYITQLQWDCSVIYHNGIYYGYLNVLGEYPVIDAFNYQRAIHHPIRIIETNIKDINIFIEKKYFEQLPANPSPNFNPFEVIIQQQFYEVEPDPRGCTTIATDHNIYSSRIIWADNIMTMRRDVNVMGGTVEVLQYDYAALKATVDSLREMLRLQAAYNEYIADVQKSLQIANSIIQVLTSAVSIASTLSNLNISSENMRVNTYRTEQFHFGGGGFGPGGGGSGGGGSGGGGKLLDGQFLLSFDGSANGVDIRRFIPTTITATTEPIVGAIANLTATNLVMTATNLLTGIGDLTASLTPNQLTFNRVPVVVEQPNRNTISQVHMITESSRNLSQRSRERNQNMITLVEFRQHDGINELELEDIDIDEPERVEQEVQTDEEQLPHVSNEAPIEPNEIQETPSTTMESTTTSTVQTIEPDNDSLPVITDRDGNDYTLARLADMTYEQLTALVPRVNGLSITSHVQNTLFHTYTLYLNEQQIVQRRWNREVVTFTPSILQFRTRLHRQTTSHWWIESNGSEFTARSIERLTIPERMHLDVYLNHTIYYIPGGNQQTGETWTEIRETATNRLCAIIDYQVPSRATFTGNHITFTTPSTTQNIDADGIHMTMTNDDGSVRRIDLSRDGVTIEHDTVIPPDSRITLTHDDRTYTAADIERMTESERINLVTLIQSHGNILRFESHENELTGESWTDIIYDGQVITRIDQRIHHQVSTDGEYIIIGNPEAEHFSFSQRSLRWVRYHLTGEVSREDATISGIIGSVAQRTVHNVVSGFWSWVIHNPRDAAGAYAMIHMTRGTLLDSAIFLPIRRLINPLSLETEEQEQEATIQQLLDWCLSEDDNDVEISIEHADEMVVSFETCMNIAKTFRDSLKGPLALICSKIQDIEENGTGNAGNNPSVTSNDLQNVESRIVELERKTSNIQSLLSEESRASRGESNITTNTSGELTLANLLKSYDERLTVLEKKCANIK